MPLMAFDPNSSTNRRQGGGLGPLNLQGHEPGEMARAVAGILQHKCLTHTFGVQGEWEVRTTLVTNRQAWRYQSHVRVHGKEARKDFSPINVNLTRQKQHQEVVTEEMLMAFAREAVEVHFARCASVAEYIMMASILSNSRPRHHGIKTVALVFLSIAALLTAHWWWRGADSLKPDQPAPKPPPNSVQWQTGQVAYSSDAGEPFAFPLPGLIHAPEGIPVEIALEEAGDDLSWLQLDHEQFHLWGTAPLIAENRIYRFTVHATTAQGSHSPLLILLTIRGQPERISPIPQLPNHWTW